jgi:ABC-type Fe3+/spermidine/putrescine transport system ATPase subunit
LARFTLVDGQTVLVRCPTFTSTHGFDICLRPERISLRKPGAPTPFVKRETTNVLRGRVRVVEMLGSSEHLRIELPGAQEILAVRTRTDESDLTGAEVDVLFDARDATLIPT